jgi:hypothetical protein
VLQSGWLQSGNIWLCVITASRYQKGLGNSAASIELRAHARLEAYNTPSRGLGNMRDLNSFPELIQDLGHEVAAPGFETRGSECIFFNLSNPSGRTSPWGSLSL